MCGAAHGRGAGRPDAIGMESSTVMALLSTPRTAEVRYNDASIHGLARTPSTTSTTIHLQFTFDESRLYFVGPPLPAPFCLDHLALGGTMKLTSDDGAFNEVIETQFLTVGSDFLVSDIMIPAKDIHGSFSLATAGANDGDRFTFRLHQTIVADAWVGTLSVNDTPFVDWGSTPCDSGSTPITADDANRSALAVQAVNTITTAPVPLAFSDGTITVAHLSFPQSPLACRLVSIVVPGVLNGPSNGIQLTGPLAVATEDNRWVGTLQGKASVGGVAGALTGLQLSIDSPILPVEEFAAYYGFSGVDFGVFARALLWFTVTYAVDRSQRASGGKFEIYATKSSGVGPDAGNNGSADLLTAKVSAP